MTGAYLLVSISDYWSKHWSAKQVNIDADVYPVFG